MCWSRQRCLQFRCSAGNGSNVCCDLVSLATAASGPLPLASSKKHQLRMEKRTNEQSLMPARLEPLHSGLHGKSELCVSRGDVCPSRISVQQCVKLDLSGFRRVLNKWRDARLLLVRPPPEWYAGGYPGGVLDCLLYVTARPATKAPVTALLLAGSSLHGGRHLHLVRRLRASLALTGCDVALLTEQARGGVRKV